MVLVLVFGKCKFVCYASIKKIINLKNKTPNNIIKSENITILKKNIAALEADILTSKTHIKEGILAP